MALGACVVGFGGGVMKRWKSIAAVAAVSTLMAPGLSSAMAPGAAARSSGWITLDVPDPLGYSRLTSASAAAADDVWAASGQLLFHYDGSAWSAIDPPSGSSAAAVSATPGAVWVAGSKANGKPMLVSRTGTTWHQIPTSAIGSSFRPTAVLAFSASDVWIAGSVGQAPNQKAAAAHWDGQNWGIDTLKTSGDCVIIPGIAALPHHQGLMFVGQTGPCGRGKTKPLSLEWLGKQHLVSMPSLDVVGTFTGVVVRSQDNAWAVGARTKDAWASEHALLAHWNGTAWKAVGTPAVKGFAQLTGIAVDATGTFLAVGRQQAACLNCYAPGRTLAFLGKGGAWSKIGTPDPFTTSTSEDAFLALTAVPGTSSFWAVGTAGQGTPQAWAARYSH